MSRKHFRIGRLWYKSCAKHSSPLVYDCPQSTVQLHRLEPRPADIFWHRAEGSRHRVFPPQHPQAALHIHVHTHTQASPNISHKRNNFHSPIPCMLQKRLPGTVTPDSPALPTTDRPRTLPDLDPEIQYSIANLFSNKALGTYLDLTFLKTSSTYAEGCNRGKTSSAYQETFQRKHVP